MARFSDDEIARYARQIVLPEVGGLGQERLRAASARAASEIEALYLAAAGVGSLRVPTHAIAEAVRAINPLVEVSVDEVDVSVDDVDVSVEVDVSVDDVVAPAHVSWSGDSFAVEQSALAALATLTRILAPS